MLCEESVEWITILLREVVLMLHNCHIYIFQIDLVNNISREIIQMWNIRRKTVSKLHLESHVFCMQMFEKGEVFHTLTDCTGCDCLRHTAANRL